MTQQLLTPYQSQYYAWLLTRRAAGDTVESLASTLADAQVDLNPHQVEAALFACKNLLSQGIILADEVGLGKTVKTGLVVSQSDLESDSVKPKKTAKIKWFKKEEELTEDLFGKQKQ